MSRYCLPENTHFSNVAKMLDFTPTAKLVNGYGSTGAIGTTAKGQEAFLRVPLTDTRQEAHNVLYHYGLAGNTGVLAVIALMGERDYRVLPYTVPEAFNPQIWESSIPHSSIGAAMLLEPLSYSESLTQVIDMQEHKRARSAYGRLGSQLRDIHTTQSVPVAMRNWWKNLSLRHIISGRERFDDVVRHIDYSQGWTHHDQVRRIRSKTLLLLEHLSASYPNITRVHFDAWRDNVAVSEDGADIQLFDSALAYGPPGCDLAFVIGDQLLEFLTKGNQNALDNVQQFLKAYGDYSSIKTQPFPFFVFKCVVGAAFDEYSPEMRKRIMIFADDLITYNLNKPKEGFTVELLQDLWRQVVYE